jgi:hypothetical protein
VVVIDTESVAANNSFSPDSNFGSATDVRIPLDEPVAFMRNEISRGTLTIYSVLVSLIRLLVESVDLVVVVICLIKLLIEKATLIVVQFHPDSNQEGIRSDAKIDGMESAAVVIVNIEASTEPVGALVMCSGDISRILADNYERIDQLCSDKEVFKGLSTECSEEDKVLEELPLVIPEFRSIAGSIRCAVNEMVEALNSGNGSDRVNIYR